MIVVVGWPRSGTSVLMQMLAAGGLRAYSSPRRKQPFPGNRHGVWELPSALLTPVPALRHIYEHGGADDACVKLFYRHISELLDTDLWPDAILMTKRPLTDVVASWGALWPKITVDTTKFEDARKQAKRALADAGTPVLEVPIVELVDAPGKWAKKIAKFVQPFTSFPLDVPAMTAVPNPADLHFR